MMIATLLEILNNYFLNGLYIQRSSDRSSLFSTYPKMSLSYEVNFLFVENIYEYSTRSSATRDLNCIIREGLVFNGERGVSYATKMLDLMLQNDLMTEYEHLTTVIDDSICIKKYIEKGYKKLLGDPLAEEMNKKYDVDDNKLSKIRELIKGGYLSEIRKEKESLYTRLSNDLVNKLNEDTKKITDEKHNEYTKKIIKQLNAFRNHTILNSDVSMLLTLCLAYSLAALEIPRYDDVPESKRKNCASEESVERIRFLQEQLDEAIKRFVENNKRKPIEELLISHYYSAYKILSEVKDRNNSRIIHRVFGKFEEVYQLQEIVYSYGESNDWNLSTPLCKKSIVWAPNGSGKTTFMKGILFSATYSFRKNNDELNDISKEKIHQLKEFHGLSSDDYFVVYIEAKYYPDIENKEKTKWIYEIVRRQICFDKSIITEEEFYSTIRKYNQRKKLIYLIDGYDEIGFKYKEGFLAKVEELTNSNSEYGANAIVIITSRPSMESRNFGEYSFWNLKGITFDKNPDFIKNFISAYCINASDFSSDDIYKMISQNNYLREIITTPAILMEIISGCAEYLHSPENKSVCDIVDETIDTMIKRIDSRNDNKVDKYGGIDSFKTVYEVLAYEYLCGRKGINEGNFGSILNSTIELLVEEKAGKRRFKLLQNIFDDDVSELFFSWMSIIKSDGKYITFLSDVFAEHLAARRIITLLNKEDHLGEYTRLLQCLDDKKYDVFVMLCTMAYQIRNAELQDTVLPKIGNIFSTIIEDVSSDKSNHFYNAAKVRDMIIKIVLKKYGENIITHRLLSEVVCKNKDNIFKIINENPTDRDSKQQDYSQLLCELWD